MSEVQRLWSYTAAGARAILTDVLVPIWEAVYGDIAADDPFFTTEQFVARFDGYSSASGFTLCTAGNDENVLLEMAFGYTLQPGARWWNGLQTDVPDGFTTEDGHRTFAINEIMVLESERRQGIATVLHDLLLDTRDDLAFSPRAETRATLLVEPENTPARQAYLSWGWETIGVLKPFPDSPTYESMILSLPRPHRPTPP